ncbi:putative uracil-DNA glycosylase-like [Scophthalmus maximus]|uniref:Uracil-DNA glycosylase n=1 Tax=Scophthalmus maximus TaxID=52904 RepID=A0A2U9BS84_SCOMX|nr:putative uracil-DNA glycosylase-like [Scophthalmus maximus]
MPGAVLATNEGEQQFVLNGALPLVNEPGAVLLHHQLLSTQLHPRANVSLNKMIGQKTIQSFFSPVSKKRVSKELNETEEDATDTKKLKAADPSSPPPPGPCTAALSPEQLDRISRNKRAALERLAAAQPLPGFGESWRKELSAEFGKPYFKRLTEFVSEERQRHTVFPPAEQVFTWTQMCDVRDVKVVILGQDPYHGPNQAHGLCFSVKRPVPPPPSLGNMYKELVSDIEGFQHPGHGDLTGWAQQGVLLLNAVLTVREHQANSHKDRGWETFTDAVVQWLSDNLEGVVFMLWGSYAHKKGAAINRKRHHVLQTVHPSPLSAHRGFFGCRHFSKANELLKESGKSPIDWKTL